MPLGYQKLMKKRGKTEEGAPDTSSKAEGLFDDSQKGDDQLFGEAPKEEVKKKKGFLDGIIPSNLFNSNKGFGKRGGGDSLDGDDDDDDDDDDFNTGDVEKGSYGITSKDTSYETEESNNEGYDESSEVTNENEGVGDYSKGFEENGEEYSTGWPEDPAEVVVGPDEESDINKLFGSTEDTAGYVGEGDGYRDANGDDFDEGTSEGSSYGYEEKDDTALEIGNAFGGEEGNDFGGEEGDDTNNDGDDFSKGYDEESASDLLKRHSTQSSIEFHPDEFSPNDVEEKETKMFKPEPRHFEISSVALSQGCSISIEALAIEVMNEHQIINVSLAAFGTIGAMYEPDQLTLITFGMHKFIGRKLSMLDRHRLYYHINELFMKSGKDQLTIKLTQKISFRDVMYTTLVADEEVLKEYSSLFFRDVLINIEETDEDQLVAVIKSCSI